MIGNRNIFFFISPLRNHCCGHLLELPHQGDSNKYLQHTFPGVLNIIFLNIPNNRSHLELRICSTVILTSSVIILTVGIETADCKSNIKFSKFRESTTALPTS